eukprot:838475_1
MQSLLYRTDYKGTMCSTNEEANRPLAAWLSVTYPSLYICVESCAPGTVKIALYLNQSSQFMKQCLPPKEVIATVGGFGGTTENLANGVADVLTAAPLLGAGAAVAIVLAFIYVWFLRGFAGCLVWTAIAG